MSLEAIKSISAAEDEARLAKSQAIQRAQDAIVETEKNGKESVGAMIKRAETEVAQLIRSADKQAEQQAVELASTTANRQATLRARAEGRLDKAARFIVERIVGV